MPAENNGRESIPFLAIGRSRPGRGILVQESMLSSLMATATSICLIEQSKAHVLVRLLLKSRKTSEHTTTDSQEIKTTNLFFFFLFLLLLFRRSTTTTTSSSTSNSNSPSSARRNLEKNQPSAPDQNSLMSIKRTEASFEEPSAINCDGAQRHTSQCQAIACRDRGD